jgi:hypothetical protein
VRSECKMMRSPAAFKIRVGGPEKEDSFIWDFLPRISPSAAKELSCARGGGGGQGVCAFRLVCASHLDLLAFASSREEPPGRDCTRGLGEGQVVGGGESREMLDDDDDFDDAMLMELDQLEAAHLAARAERGAASPRGGLQPQQQQVQQPCGVRIEPAEHPQHPQQQHLQPRLEQQGPGQRQNHASKAPHARASGDRGLAPPASEGSSRA